MILFFLDKKTWHRIGGSEFIGGTSHVFHNSCLNLHSHQSFSPIGYKDFPFPIASPKLVSSSLFNRNNIRCVKWYTIMVLTCSSLIINIMLSVSPSIYWLVWGWGTTLGAIHSWGLNSGPWHMHGPHLNPLSYISSLCNYFIFSFKKNLLRSSYSF